MKQVNKEGTYHIFQPVIYANTSRKIQNNGLKSSLQIKKFILIYLKILQTERKYIMQ